MIIDRLENKNLYSGLGNNVAKALDFLKNSDFSNMSPGRYEIDGEDVFAMVSEYQTKPKQEGVWEAHRRYIDIQFVADGIEGIGYSHLSELEITQDYDSDGDCLLLAGEGDFFVAKKGTFAILYPEDGHMPGIEVEQPSKVKKVVVKVLV
ncbi:MAG: YhcH/YjgK/YiaL family protein [Clostridia bacterium]|nr:YhcH/YjgK/YiaL family protein [Clostridia bacterium]